jgi:hypothetical protein
MGQWLEANLSWKIQGVLLQGRAVFFHDQCFRAEDPSNPASVALAYKEIIDFVRENGPGIRITGTDRDGLHMSLLPRGPNPHKDPTVVEPDPTSPLLAAARSQSGTVLIKTCDSQGRRQRIEAPSADPYKVLWPLVLQKLEWEIEYASLSTHERALWMAEEFRLKLMLTICRGGTVCLGDRRYKAAGGDDLAAKEKLVREILADAMQLVPVRLISTNAGDLIALHASRSQSHG